MKEYLTYIYDEKPSWDSVPKAEISCYQWEGSEKYRPEAYAKMCFVKDKGVYVLLMCSEEAPKTDCKSVNDPVYHDSCLEMFLSFGQEGYLNIETNSAGVYLSEFGKTRGSRRFLSDITSEVPTVTPQRVGAYWGNEIFFPNIIFKALYPDFDTVRPGTYRGNFYKCGDLTEIPHYGSFAPMGAFELGFHNPELFAYFIVKGRNENGK